jgi:hypothetical protein
METKRDYSGSDSYLLERAQTILAQFGNDIALFITFTVMFEAPFYDNFKAAITAALEQGTDETEQDIISDLTQKVIDAMENCFRCYREVKFFAEQAFPANKSKQGEFGTNDYEAARRSQARMIQFMTTMHRVAEKYKTELFAKGYTQARIDQILTLRDTLQDTNTTQEVAINNRPVVTSERIEKLNNVYAIMSKVNDAAQVIFATDEAKKATYVYLPGSSTSTVTRSGNANPGINTIANVAYVADRLITFYNKGTQPLEFGISDNQTEIQGYVVVLKAGEDRQLKSSELSTAGNYILCQNPNAAPLPYKLEYED